MRHVLSSRVGAMLLFAGLFLPLLARSDERPAVAAGVVTDTDVEAAIKGVQQEPTRESLATLMGIDEAVAERRDAVSQRQQVQTLQVLALSQDAAALDHVRAVFEADTERRDEAAHALALYCQKRARNPQDWRFLVRSLPLVEGEQARAVLRALLRFQTRATKPQWLRQVNLVGLPLDAEGQAEAVSLLAAWSGRSATDDGQPLQTLTDWQEWFRDRYPQLPAPVAAQDVPNARWKFAELADRLATEESTPERLQQGRVVFEKANCSRCHRKEGFGERWAPDLSSVGWRLQKKQQLEATLFPSHQLNEEYPTFTVITRAGRVLNGLMMAAGADEIRVVGTDGNVTVLPRAEIEEAVESNRSSMPDGLLEPLEYDEIRDLFLYLDHLGPNADTSPRADD